MKNRYPTAAQLYAVELEARRLRAEHIAKLARRAASAWHRFWAPKGVAPKGLKGLNHA
jgi:hypothetical protein